MSARYVGTAAAMSVAQIVEAHNAEVERLAARDARLRKLAREHARVLKARKGFKRASKRAPFQPKHTDKQVAMPRSVWFLRCKGGLFILSKPYFTRKEAREVAKKRKRGEVPVGPFVLAERRGQE